MSDNCGLPVPPQTARNSAPSPQQASQREAPRESPSRSRSCQTRRGKPRPDKSGAPPCPYFHRGKYNCWRDDNTCCGSPETPHRSGPGCIRDRRRTPPRKACADTARRKCCGPVHHREKKGRPSSRCRQRRSPWSDSARPPPHNASPPGGRYSVPCKYSDKRPRPGRRASGFWNPCRCSSPPGKQSCPDKS